MADIELVVKIPEDVYKNIKSQKFWLDSGLSLSDAYNCIAKGTPLPKGHGRLGDLSALAHKMCMANIDCLDSEEVAGLMLWFCDKAPTIIEADTAESEG